MYANCATCQHDPNHTHHLPGGVHYRHNTHYTSIHYQGDTRSIHHQLLTAAHHLEGTRYEPLLAAYYQHLILTHNNPAPSPWEMFFNILEYAQKYNKNWEEETRFTQLTEETMLSMGEHLIPDVYLDPSVTSPDFTKIIRDMLTPIIEGTVDYDYLDNYYLKHGEHDQLSATYYHNPLYIEDHGGRTVLNPYQKTILYTPTVIGDEPKILATPKQNGADIRIFNITYQEPRTYNTLLESITSTLIDADVFSPYTGKFQSNNLPDDPAQRNKVMDAARIYHEIHRAIYNTYLLLEEYAYWGANRTALDDVTHHLFSTALNIPGRYEGTTYQKKWEQTIHTIAAHTATNHEDGTITINPVAIEGVIHAATTLQDHYHPIPESERTQDWGDGFTTYKAAYHPVNVNLVMSKALEEYQGTFPWETVKELPTPALVPLFPNIEVEPPTPITY